MVIDVDLDGDHHLASKDSELGVIRTAMQVAGGVALAASADGVAQARFGRQGFVAAPAYGPTFIAARAIRPGVHPRPAGRRPLEL